MKFLNADEERVVKKDANAILRKLHAKPGRNLGHLTEGTGVYKTERGDCEKAVATLHRTNDTGVSRVIQKRVAPGNDAANMISQMHSDPATFADRPIAGNSGLVTKLAGAVVELVKRDFKNAKAAKTALRKMIGNSED